MDTEEFGRRIFFSLGKRPKKSTGVRFAEKRRGLCLIKSYMNKNEKDLLDEQSRILSDLPISAIQKLLVGLPPLEPGEFFPVIFQNEYGTVSCIFDTDALIYKLKSRIAASCKFDIKVIREYMKKEGITEDQARALLAMRNLFLCNDFSIKGIKFFITQFTARFDEAFDEMVKAAIRAALDAWRRDKNTPPLENIGIEKLPVFNQIKKDFIQSQGSGRPAGGTAKKKAVDADKRAEEEKFLRELLHAAAVEALRKTPNAQLTYDMLAKQIVELERSNNTTGEEGTGKKLTLGLKHYAVKSAKQTQTVKKQYVSKQIVHKWIRNLGEDILDIDNNARAYLKLKKR